MYPTSETGRRHPPATARHSLVRAWLLLVLSWSHPGVAEDPWVTQGTDGEPRIELYFYWAGTCPHCLAAYPHVQAIPEARPWIRLHALELSGHPQHVALYREMAAQLGEQAAGVPALLFCGQIYVGWESDETTGKTIRRALDDCRARVLRGADPVGQSERTDSIRVPLIGDLDPAALSLPTLTLVLAGLDAFNPCAFFVLLFLLSLIAHQKSQARMSITGGVFVAVSGAMYFAFMAAWLNVFQLIGHLAWVTLAAGALAVLVGLLNVKDFFLFRRGLGLSIPESRKPDLFRRARRVLNADRLPAMLSATVVLAIAANFYELLCTAGFPMVYTRLLTLAEPSAAARYGYLVAYNLIYVVPLALIVVAFVRTLGARRLTEREGRLLKLMSGVMMLELGLLLLLAPQLLGRVGIALGLMAVAVGTAWLAARLTRPKTEERAA